MRLAERLGLHRPELRAWALYDVANSVFMTTVIQVFQVYFLTVAAADLPRTVASTRMYTATAVGALLIALCGPLLGALADYLGIKKRLLAAFMGMGVSATAGLYFVGRGDWLLGAALYVLGNVGVGGTLVFYDALLPHVAREDELDRVSTAGYALGYLGGGLLLALNLIWLQNPSSIGLADTAAATRLAFLSAAVWWLVFTIPLLRRVPEPPRQLEAGEHAGQNPLRVAFKRLGHTLRTLRSYRQAFLMFLAFLIYNDGINTIIKVGATYGTEIGVPQTSLLLAILLIQFVGVPFSFLFGWLAGRLGAKRSILLGLAVYLVIAVFGYGMTSTAHFFVLALLIATVQGGTQGLSRSLFATLVPKHRSSEFFGFYAISEKFAGVVGPVLFAVMVGLTGSSRHAILALVVFFLVGGALLAKVDVAAGQATAREADAQPVAKPVAKPVTKP
jgi:UMF1 family MFS transporter